MNSAGPCQNDYCAAGTESVQNLPDSIQGCDNQVVNNAYAPPPPPPDGCGDGCGGYNCDTTNMGYCSNDQEYCECQQFAGVWDDYFCTCSYFTPVVVDINGDGFNLTGAADGVNFDLHRDG